MINLLPPQYEEELKQEENWKLVLTLAILVLLFLLSLTLILLSIKIYLSGQIEMLKIFYNQREREFTASQIQGFEEKIQSINQNLSQLDSFYQSQINFAEFFEKISKLLPAGTYLTQFSSNPLEIKGKIEYQISLSGFCPTREILFEFKKKLEAQEEIKEVYFPPSNWVKAKEIDFQVNFKLK